MVSVIKPEQIGPESGIPLPIAFNIEDIQSRAKQYLLEIQQNATRIVDEARAEADQIRQQARQEGIAEASAQIEKQIEQAATEKSNAKCRTAIAACETTVANLTKENSTWLTEWRDQTVALGCKIAEKIVRKELNNDIELLRAWLEEAIVSMRDRREIQAQVHPDDFAVAGRFMQQIARSIPQAASVEIIPNPEVSPGGCIVKSETGSIDLQIETQLERLAEQLS